MRSVDVSALLYVHTHTPTFTYTHVFYINIAYIYSIAQFT